MEAVEVISGVPAGEEGVTYVTVAVATMMEVGSDPAAREPLEETEVVRLRRKVSSDQTIIDLGQMTYFTIQIMRNDIRHVKQSSVHIGKLANRRRCLQVRYIVDRRPQTITLGELGREY